MLKKTVIIVYVSAWSIVTVIISIKKGEIPPEFWTIPAMGLGAIASAMNSIERRRRSSDQDQTEDEE